MLRLMIETIVDLRINETRHTGGVCNHTYKPGSESVYLFLEFTILGVTHFSS